MRVSGFKWAFSKGCGGGPESRLQGNFTVRPVCFSAGLLQRGIARSAAGLLRAAAGEIIGYGL